MKITIDCRYIGKSGIGTYTMNMVRAMVMHKEHEYLLLVPHIFPEFEGFKNVKQQLCDIKPFSKKELLCSDWDEVNKCDVYLSPYFNLSLGIKIQTYITIHDVIFMDLPNLVSKAGYWFRKLYLRWAASKAKVIFTVSEFSKNRIEHHLGNKKPIHVVCNVVGDKIKNSPIVNLDKEDYYIFVGNVKQHKGLSTLLDAYRIAKAEGLTCKLKIVGETDSFRTKDTEIAQKLDRLSDVEFTGRVSDEELISLIGQAKALVLPSLYEGFGIPPMEALYLGTHAIVSDIEVLKEIYKDLPVTFFKVGDTEDLKDKLLAADTSVIDIPAVRKQIDERYSMDRTAQTILKVIEHK